MTLNEAVKNHNYEIIDITRCDEALKKRFLSFGIHQGVQCTLLHHSIKKATLSIRINHIQVALRTHEAQYLVVKPLESL
ncbi:FeoA family protein [Helicobacter cetorum]|uniref:Ferrous iron transport protein A n=1 Tax=Helicobacter cetorum (strain ATCC BAA-540 / CCUG 52418 / MIT 99-5656) TaxID=1163745 RepID=I0EQS8_HELCM|nr:FeoA domain-containing protein [Helicobacter cetorum]AFI05297.1 ferrous iron transport protein A [Helicobacter cetorum MIT 99-5656]